MIVLTRYCLVVTGRSHILKQTCSSTSRVDFFRRRTTRRKTSSALLLFFGVHFWVKFSIQNVVLGASRRKNLKTFFSVKPFFVFLTKCLSTCPNTTKPSLSWKISGCRLFWGNKTLQQHLPSCVQLCAKYSDDSQTKCC